MDLVYSSADKTSIKATLAAGESLGNITGPTEAFIPVDDENTEYAAILDEKLTIQPFVEETPPTGA
jgi:hypothetical protein